MPPNLDKDDLKGQLNDAYVADEDSLEKKDDSSNSSASSIPDKDGKKKKKKKEKPPAPELPPVPFFQLFRFASGTDIALAVLASLAAVGTGILFPIMLILFGDITDAFVGGGLTQEEITELSCNISLYPNETFPPPP